MTIQLGIVILYLVATLLVAVWVSRSNRDADSYSLAGRNVPGWAVGLSVLGTFTSSITFLGLPQKAYAENWNAFMFGAALPIAALIATRWFVPLYRRTIRYSVYEYLEDKFGYWARAYGAASYLALQLIRIATVLLLVTFAVTPMLNTPIIPTILVLGTLIVIYDTLGGLRAVIWTDVVQVSILCLGAVWCLALLVSMHGGLAEFFGKLPMERLSLAAWNKQQQASDPWHDLFDLAKPTIFVVFIYGLSENLRNYGTDENYVQRYLSTGSDGAAKFSVWLGALSYVPVSLVFLMIGSGLQLTYPEGPVETGVELTADQVFPYFINHALPAPVTGLIIGAILAAGMSTVDSSLNACSTVILADFVKRRFGDMSARRELLVLRLATILTGILGTTAAAVLYWRYQAESRGVMDMWWQYAGTAGGGLFGLFTVAWLAPRTRSWVAAAGVVSTLPILIWGTFARDLVPPFDRYNCWLHPNLVGIAATVCLWAVVAVLRCVPRR